MPSAPADDSAEFVEAYDVQREFLEPIQEAVKLRLVADRGHDAGPAPAGLHREIAEQPGQQLLALPPEDDPVLARPGGRGHGRDSSSSCCRISPASPERLALHLSYTTTG